MIAKEQFKERFPNHCLCDKYDYDLQQFTANDMIDFANEVAEASLKKASEKGKVKQEDYFSVDDSIKINGVDIWEDMGNSVPSYIAIIDKESITNPDNIVIS